MKEILKIAYKFIGKVLDIIQKRNKINTMKKDWKKEYLSFDRFKTTTSNERDSNTVDNRLPVERDLGRAIFSPACRRLHDKTQVFPLTNDDNIHSRLTHSLEVMNVGKSFALNIAQYDNGKDEKERKWEKRNLKDPYYIDRVFSSILQVVCLIHDIGNPPFGHFGERSIQNYFINLFDEMKDDRGLGFFIKSNLEKTNYLSKAEGKELKKAEDKRDELVINRMKRKQNLVSSFIMKSYQDIIRKNCNERLDYTLFDGNAEGFRVITKLQYAGDLYGLNLCKSVLAASIKYPNYQEKDDTYIAYHKHGIFVTEIPELEKLADECGMRRSDRRYKRHPLCFLMEAADSICYMAMDIEDAILKNWITIEEVLGKVGNYKLKETPIRNIYNKYIPQEQKEVPNKGRQCIALRSALLAYLVNYATEEFMSNLDKIEEGVYIDELLEKDSVSKELLGITKNKVLCHREIMSLEVTGDAVITGIFDAYIKMLFHKDKDFRDRGKCMISQSVFKTVLHEHYDKYKDSEEFKVRYSNVKNVESLYYDFDVADFTVEERFRLMRDFVAGMTDKFALSHYRRLSGQKI